MPQKTLDRRSLVAASKKLADRDPHLRISFESFGPPPLWDRPQGFSTLLQIILEQQVSLASAKACFDKLAVRLGSVSPDGLLQLTDAELKADGFSRQKTSYARHLAAAVLEERIDLDALSGLPDDDVRCELKTLKGIGDWSADIYLLMAMLRPDVMPRGDLALHAAWQRLSGSEHRPDAGEFVTMAEKWRPFRSVAARLLWHFYLSERNGRAKRSSSSSKG
jgi:DNA-3-methyladenine glycosylase II